jgi:hypothetical protein
MTLISPVALFTTTLLPVTTVAVCCVVVELPFALLLFAL